MDDENPEYQRGYWDSVEELISMLEDYRKHPVMEHLTPNQALGIIISGFRQELEDVRG